MEVVLWITWRMERRTVRMIGFAALLYLVDVRIEEECRDQHRSHSFSLLVEQ